MFSDRFLDDKYLKKLDNQLQLMIKRHGVDRKTYEEVFDRSTLFALEKLFSDRVIDTFDFPISTGKEGNVFRAITPSKDFVAVKIYRVSTSTFKNLSKYILGDPRFEIMPKKRRDIIYEWTKKEYKNLIRLNKIKVNSPKPILMNKNVLVMGYIGDKNKPAPLLKDVKVKEPKKLFKTIIKFISKMYNEADMVHSDMSAFNILMHRNKPYLIDLGQAVLLEHPYAHDFLKRDIHNIVTHFKKYKIKADEEEIYHDIVNLKKG